MVKVDKSQKTSLRFAHVSQARRLTGVRRSDELSRTQLQTAMLPNHDDRIGGKEEVQVGLSLYN